MRRAMQDNGELPGDVVAHTPDPSSAHHIDVLVSSMYASVESADVRKGIIDDLQNNTRNCTGTIPYLNNLGKLLDIFLYPAKYNRLITRGDVDTSYALYYRGLNRVFRVPLGLFTYPLTMLTENELLEIVMGIAKEALKAGQANTGDGYKKFFWEVSRHILPPAAVPPSEAPFDLASIMRTKSA